MQKKKPCGMKFYARRKREGNHIFVECRNFQFSLDGNLFTFFVASYPPSLISHKRQNWSPYSYSLLLSPLLRQKVSVKVW